MLRAVIRYPLNEVFYTLQGEGFYSGRPAVFIRFSGCSRTCDFCDTDHTEKFEMTPEEIVDSVKNVCPVSPNLIILTGGEPTIHDLESVCRELVTHFLGIEIAIETNGYDPSQLDRLKKRHLIDWITFSPKEFVGVSQDMFDLANEIKIVYDEKNDPLAYLPLIPEELFDRNCCFIQPCSENFQPAIFFVQQNPQWRLSVQTQKILGVR
ncbi:MAG: 7-carboxy-7-deazaguanine synthase QueE [Candidatus Peribacteraceae bacterium]|nr:7-carboxy-7-deazaguanine synthase QueE [Candidatus Peribacteraceae bacterium]